mgnify:CR=1 FL=1
MQKDFWNTKNNPITGYVVEDKNVESSRRLYETNQFKKRWQKILTNLNEK